MGGFFYGHVSREYSYQVPGLRSSLPGFVLLDLLFPVVFSFFTRSLIVLKLFLFISSLTESVVKFSLKLVSRV